MPRQKQARVGASAVHLLGREIEYWRELRGLTSAELATMIGVSRRTISGAEDASNKPSEAVVLRLELALESNGLLHARYDAVLAEQRRLKRYNVSLQGVRAAGASPEDASIFLGETVPDGTLMGPGHRFTKSWTIRNAGSVVWRDRFLGRLGIAASPGLITTPSRVALPVTAPGEQITIEVPCVAQLVEGTSAAVFKMTDDAGHLFFPDRYGIGLQVQVTVVLGMGVHKS